MHRFGRESAASRAVPQFEKPRPEPPPELPELAQQTWRDVVSSYVAGGATEEVVEVRPIGHERTFLGKSSQVVERWQSGRRCELEKCGRSSASRR
jgi:hypothetical protein